MDNPSNSPHRQRCQWATNDPLYQQYHDQEWGVPCFDDATLFEFLLLEGMQAGLSWITILKKRQNFQQALWHFNPHKLAKLTDQQQAVLLQNPGIIRNRLKIAACRHNAQAFLATQAEFDSFAAYCWQFVDGEPIANCWQTHADVPTSTTIAQQLSKDLKRRGFKFVGDTICYAFMQAVGMVNDHTTDCFRHHECQLLHRQFPTKR